MECHILHLKRNPPVSASIEDAWRDCDRKVLVRNLCFEDACEGLRSTILPDFCDYLQS
jgi:hypothetical protein